MCGFWRFLLSRPSYVSVFFNDTATTEIYTLSLHDALPISAMFHPLLLWSCWTLAIWLYCFRPSHRTILCVVFASVILLPAVQEAKWRYRGGTAEDDLLAATEVEAMEPDSLDKAVAWVGNLSGSLGRTV